MLHGPADILWATVISREMRALFATQQFNIKRQPYRIFSSCGALLKRRVFVLEKYQSGFDVVSSRMNEIVIGVVQERIRYVKFVYSRDDFFYG